MRDLCRLWHRILAFLRRDFLIAISYKFQFVFHLTSGIFIVATFYFVSKLVDPSLANPTLVRYGTDYFSFVLIGLAASGFLHVGLSGFSERLRSAMTEGALEMMFATPTRPIWIVVMPCLWSFFFEGVRAVVVVGLGIVIFGADLTEANLWVCSLLVMIIIVTYSVFGLLSAAVIMILKRGDPVNWAFANAAAFLSGAYFPVDLLPAPLQAVAKVLPMTYAYDGLRLTLLRGAALADVATDVVILVVFSGVGIPLAAWICGRAIAFAKRDGSLGTF